jgi:hypothetical protein
VGLHLAHGPILCVEDMVVRMWWQNQQLFVYSSPPTPHAVGAIMRLALARAGPRKGLSLPLSLSRSSQIIAVVVGIRADVDPPFGRPVAVAVVLGMMQAAAHAAGLRGRLEPLGVDPSPGPAAEEAAEAGERVLSFHVSFYACMLVEGEG